VQFQVEVAPVPNSNRSDRITFSLNPVRAAATFNSNCLCEMSQRSKPVFSEVDPAGTLVLDEIDVEFWE